jgi:hypothetical protein
MRSKPREHLCPLLPEIRQLADGLGMSAWCQLQTSALLIRPGGRAAVSVNTVPERSYNHQINVILTRYVPGLAEAVTRTFSLGEASRLEELFRGCGFSQIETRAVRPRDAR